MIKPTAFQMKYQFGLIILLAVLLVIAVQGVYYLEITKVAKSKEEAFTKNIISQVVETTNLIFDKTKRAAVYFSYSNYVQTFMASNDPLEIYENKKYIEDMIKTGVEINDEIEKVVLLNPDWKRIYYYNDNQISAALDQIQTVVQTSGSASGYLYIKGDPIGNHDVVAYFMPVVYAKADRRRGEQLGSIVIILNPDVLRNMIKHAASSHEVEFYIVDKKGEVVATNIEGESTPTNIKWNAKEFPRNNTMTITKTIGSTGWSMTGIVNGSNVLRDYEFFKSMVMTVGIIMVLLLATLGWVFNRSFVKPLSSLFSEIGGIGEVDYHKKLEMPYKNEIGGIAAHINNMLNKLENLTDRHLQTQRKMHQIELSRKQTELYALQSQVNPHFLFNTLQCIGGIALSKDIPEIAEMTVSMAEIFNYSIKGEDDVQIGEEIFISEQYLKIIDIRFAGRFRWRFEIDPAMLRQKTIKMILQPLVENAVYHGLEKSYKEGLLFITGKMGKKNMMLEIRDNGPGMDADTLSRINKIFSDPVELEKESISKQKIGLANIHWRIRLKYGDMYGLKIVSVSNQGTVVHVKLPLEPTNK